MPSRSHGARALLNRPPFHSTAAIVAEVEDTSDWKPGRNGDGKRIKPGSDSWTFEPEAMLAISNCDRTIQLEVDWETKAGRRNTLDKVDAMIEALQAFRDGLVIEQERYVARKKAAKR